MVDPTDQLLLASGLQTSTLSLQRNLKELRYSKLKMRWLVAFFILTLLSAAQALSAAGNRLLVVLEELKEKDKYSQLWTDLECKL